MSIPPTKKELDAMPLMELRAWRDWIERRLKSELFSWDTEIEQIVSYGESRCSAKGKLLEYCHHQGYYGAAEDVRKLANYAERVHEAELKAYRELVAA